VNTELFGLVEKPVRYIGQEWNQVVKPPVPGLVRAAFAFPDSYEIGMSHLGLRILYDALNREPDLALERVFCPAVDMEAALRRFGQPLATLETHTPLRDLDVVGFSLQFEMEYTNVLTMLDLGGIPLRSEDRTLEHPLVAAGGPCAFSPEPMADFIDVFVIGDGEEAFARLMRRWAELQGNRIERLAALAQEEGFYVPSLYETKIDAETGFAIVAGPRPGFDVPFPIQRIVLDDLARFPYPSDSIVPYGEIVHDRISVEIARGCTEGCRFCQAGIIYRPVRERSPADIIRAASQGLRDTGYDEVSLTSLSTADYSCVSSLVKTLMDQFAKDRTAMGVSSMRVYGLTRSIAEQLARVRRTGFTIAPEAGTQRMRDLINKGVTDADIEMAARIAWEQGWSQLKMYFMIGLPTETDDDVVGIARTGLGVQKLARQLGRHGAQVTVSASALVPKPHSTFQWEPMVPPDELRRRQKLILDEVRPNRAVKYKYHNVDEGVVECVLSRGDRRLGRVIEDAWRRGARFDAWTDHFDYGRWIECMHTAGLDPELFLRRIPLHAKLPWDHVDSRVTKQFLIEDLHRGMKGKFSPACEKPFIPRDPSKPVKPLESANLVCYDCGLACDLDAIKRERLAQRDSLAGPGPEIAAAFRGERAATAPAPVKFVSAPVASDGLATNAFEAASGILHGGDRLAAASTPATERFAYRVEFAKRGDLRWLSHLDLTRALQRGLRRAGFPLRYSQGFHPAPVVSFGPALAVGIEAEAELFDFECTARLDPTIAMARLAAALPAALQVRSLRPLGPEDDSLADCIQLGTYSAWWNAERQALTPEEFGTLTPARFRNAEWQAQRIGAFLAHDVVLVSRTSKGRTKEIDLRQYVRDLQFDAPTGRVRMWLRLTSQGGARPQEIMHAVYGVAGTCFRFRRDGLHADSVLEPAGR
jgi:radical SAM family uncharacterized protein/radical SAM-linked protein